MVCMPRVRASYGATRWRTGAVTLLWHLVLLSVPSVWSEVVIYIPACVGFVPPAVLDRSVVPEVFGQP